ncbi:olfactory receptor 5V1-like [Engystomops pustulosus]|uniref:olfactory receptor 5V1-like n=1 Tax=Engystomops pustulosus TaxID=76066 RepID=UPI003AFA2190
MDPQNFSFLAEFPCRYLMDDPMYISFHILPFSSRNKEKLLNLWAFSTLYFTGIFLNLVVIVGICLNAHLHSPMYVFFCNLSSIDICYTTVTIPNLLYILLSGDDLLSVTQCFSQMDCYMLCASAEVLLLFVMGFDRYVAICHPFSYHQMFQRNKCLLTVVIIWICAFLNSSLLLRSLLTLSFNKVVSIHGGSREFTLIVYVELVLLGFLPFLCNFMSYVCIFRVILHMKSKEGRRKTLSTCLSHLTVMAIYYSVGSVVYLMPFSGHTELLKQILSVFYVIIVPTINPIIYSLRNKEIITACKKLMKIS